jgi:hypothetical protein
VSDRWMGGGTGLDRFRGIFTCAHRVCGLRIARQEHKKSADFIRRRKIPWRFFVQEIALPHIDPSSLALGLFPKQGKHFLISESGKAAFSSVQTSADTGATNARCLAVVRDAEFACINRKKGIRSSAHLL